MNAPIATPQHRRPRGNIRALRIAVILAFAILAVRLANMQIINGESYAERARLNHITEDPIVGTRGLIYDRNGIPLVSNVPKFAASITPEFLPDSSENRTAMFVQLGEMLDVPVLDIQSKVETQAANSPWDEVIIKDNLSRDEAMMLEEASPRLPGVRLHVASGREYHGLPKADGEMQMNLFSHILGYMGPQSPEDAERLGEQGYSLDEWIGLSGVEYQYQSALRGDPGYTQNEVDAFGRVVAPLKTVEPEAGSSLRLSIDANLQQYIYNLLLEQMPSPDPQENSHTAAAVVMNPNNGEVYALVSVPGYDNNIFSDIGSPQNSAIYEELASDEEGRPLINHAIGDENTPGSVFKLVTATAGLEEGIITPDSGVNVPDTVFEQEGENGEPFDLVDWRAHGYVDTRAAIAWSSNMFFYMTACGFLESSAPALGPVNLAKWANLYGFGSPTGIDIPGESDGVIPTPEWKEDFYREVYGINEDWFYGDSCQMGIGQGFVTTSPLQVAVMTAAVANGGTVVTPHVAESIIDENGRANEVTTATRELPASDDTLQVVREGMLQSVTSGASTNAYRDGLAIAGKTGTAEYRFDEAANDWYEHAWFTSFAPYDNPEVVVTVYFENGWGGGKAAPVAGDIMQYYFENVSE